MRVSDSPQLPEEVPVGQKEIDLAPHPVVGLVLQEGEAEKSYPALSLESLGHFLGVRMQGSCLAVIEQDGDATRDLYKELSKGYKIK